MRLISDSAQSRELTAEIFETAFDRLESLEEAEQFEIWIKNIAAIKCFNYIHKMKPMLFLQASEADESPLFKKAEIENMEKGVLDETKSAAVMDMMLSRLDDAQRMTLMFHYYNGLSVSQIAKIMSCSQDMVKKRTAISAQRMKITLSALEAGEIILSEVDFKTALRLMAACVSVPKEIDERIGTLITSIAGEEETPPQNAEEDYSLDGYVSSLENREPGELEASTSKYTEADYSLFAERAPKLKQIDIKEEAKKAGETAKKVGKKAKKSFRKLTVTQQSVALLVAVGVIAVVVLAIALPNKKDNLEPPSSKVSSVSEPASTPSEPLPPAKTLKADFPTEVKENKATDGSVIAKAEYQYPAVSIPDNMDAENKINTYFDAERQSVLETYQSEEKKAEVEYMYSQKAWGEWKANETLAKMAAGRFDEKVLSFEKSLYTFTYGNVYGNTELEGYCFSTETGDRLELADVMLDADAYYSFAASYISTIAEEKQTSGAFESLYNDYASTISSTVRDNSRWYFTENGIKVLFEADEIVYFTYGAQSVEIPYSELASHLKAEYLPKN